MTTPSLPAWRDQVAQLRYLAVKVARVHGPTHPDMIRLAEVVATLANGIVDDHAAQALLGGRLRALTHDFQPWDGSCSSVQQLFHGLSAVAAALPAISPENA